MTYCSNRLIALSPMVLVRARSDHPLRVLGARVRRIRIFEIYEMIYLSNRLIKTVPAPPISTRSDIWLRRATRFCRSLSRNVIVDHCSYFLMLLSTCVDHCSYFLMVLWTCVDHCFYSMLLCTTA